MIGSGIVETVRTLARAMLAAGGEGGSARTARAEGLSWREAGVATLACGASLFGAL